MRLSILIIICLICSVSINQLCYASQYRSLNYDSAREEGSYNSPSLWDVEIIYPGGGNKYFTAKDVQEFVGSKTLTNLRKVDLRGQTAIDDTAIEQLAKNPTFARVETFWFRYTNITNASILTILNSPVIGSIRDRPAISGKHGCPDSVITVNVRDTKVTERETQEVFSFHIEYKPPRHLNLYPW